MDDTRLRQMVKRRPVNVLTCCAQGAKCLSKYLTALRYLTFKFLLRFKFTGLVNYIFQAKLPVVHPMIVLRYMQ